MPMSSYHLVPLKSSPVYMLCFIPDRHLPSFKGDERCGVNTYSVDVAFLCAATYNLNIWEYGCLKKLVSLSACHSLSHQSTLSMALPISTSCSSFYLNVTCHIWSRGWIKSRLVCSARRPNYSSFEEGKYNLVSCIPTQTHTLWTTWLIRDCCSASNIITLLPTLVSMETSFQSWLAPDRCESAQTKKGRGGGSLCV